jgi:hypothetical protein
MRRLVMPILTAGMLLAAGAAGAQTDAPGYTVCMRVYDGGSVSCAFTSIAQCAATASGIGATCYATSAAPGRPANQPAPRHKRPSG